MLKKEIKEYLTSDEYKYSFDERLYLICLYASSGYNKAIFDVITKKDLVNFRSFEDVIILINGFIETDYNIIIYNILMEPIKYNYLKIDKLLLFFSELKENEYDEEKVRKVEFDRLVRVCERARKITNSDDELKYSKIYIHSSRKKEENM